MAHAALSELRALDKHSLDDNDIRVDPSKSQVPAARSPTNSLYVGPGERPAAVSVNFARAYADNDKNGLSALSRRSHNRRRKRTRNDSSRGVRRASTTTAMRRGRRRRRRAVHASRRCCRASLRLLRQIPHPLSSHRTDRPALNPPIVLLA